MKLRPGDRVKVIDHDHPAYGCVGSVKQLAGQGVLVKLDHHPLITGVSRSGLRLVRVSTRQAS